jgi:hypothetical protein
MVNHHTEGERRHFDDFSFFAACFSARGHVRALVASSIEEKWRRYDKADFCSVIE